MHELHLPAAPVPAAAATAAAGGGEGEVEYVNTLAAWVGGKKEGEGGREGGRVRGREGGREGGHLTVLVGVVDDEELRSFPGMSVMFLNRVNLPSCPLPRSLIYEGRRAGSSLSLLPSLPPSVLTCGSTFHEGGKQRLQGNPREALVRS